MDNNAKDFAQKILAELRSVNSTLASLHEHFKRFVLDSTSVPGQEQNEAEARNGETKNTGNNIALTNHQARSRVSANPTGHPTNESDAHYRDLRNWLRRWKIAVEWAGAFILLAYTILTYCTLRTIRQSNVISKEALESVQRAFVGLANIQSDAITYRSAQGEERSQWQFKTRWENSGTTPATIIDIAVGGDQLATEQPSQDRFRNTKSIGAFPTYIGPRASISGGGMQLPPGLLPTKAEEVTVTTVHVNQFIVIWGWIAYRDQFRGTPMHLTEFCQYVQGETLNPREGNRIEFDFGSCQEHNCTDEYCKDYTEIRSGISKKKLATPHPR